MRVGLAALVVFGLLVGCVRFDLDEQVDESSSAVVVSDPEAVVLCPLGLAVSADGDSYGVVWHEYPANQDVVNLVFARVGADGALEVPATPVLALEGELGGLSLVAVDEGYSVAMATPSGTRALAAVIDDSGRLASSRLEAAAPQELADEALLDARALNTTCRRAARGPDEVATAFRDQHDGELRLLVEIR